MLSIFLLSTFLVTAQREGRSIEIEVLVIGGGVVGSAAAIKAARLGVMGFK